MRQALIASVPLAIVALAAAAYAADRVNVKSFGAKGDGVTDDGPAMQSAIEAASAGGTIFWPKTAACYKTSSTLTVIKPLTLAGPGPICMSARDRTLLGISSSDVSIDGLTLTGPQHSEYRDAERAIAVLGELNPKAPPNYLRHVSIRNTVISNWGGYGITTAYLDGFAFAGNRIRDVGFTGIQGLSVRNGSVSQNRIENITSGGLPGGNAYGLIFSRGTDDPGELITQPRPSNITVRGNEVDGVPTWTCFDTHSGEGISFLDNIGAGCAFGIGVGPSKNSVGKYLYAPRKITIFNNKLSSSPITAGTAQNGIVFQGVIGGESATGTIGSNVVVGYGDSTSPTGAAVEIQATKNVTVSDLVIKEPSPIGILLYGENKGLSITATTILDPWTNSAVRVGEVEGIYSKASDNEAIISGLVIKSANGRKSKILLTGNSGVAVRLADDAGGSFVIGSIDTNAKIPLLIGTHSATHRPP